MNFNKASLVFIFLSLTLMGCGGSNEPSVFNIDLVVEPAVISFIDISSELTK